MHDHDPIMTSTDPVEANESSTLPCPICKVPTSSALETAPFCSSRCRMVDLGKWMREDYVISREMKETDLDELD